MSEDFGSFERVKAAIELHGGRIVSSFDFPTAYETYDGFKSDKPKRKKKRAKYTCTLCGEPGHNIVSCTADLEDIIAKEKSKRDGNDSNDA